MYTLADLTDADYAKIRPGLKQELDKVPNLPADESIVTLDKQDKIDADILLTLTDGKTYFIVSNDLPSSWTTVDWVDFVVRLVRAPRTSKVGILREWPFLEAPLIWPWQNFTRVKNVENMATLAGEAPAGGEQPGGVNWPLIAGLVGAGLLLFVVMRRKG